MEQKTRLPSGHESRYYFDYSSVDDAKYNKGLDKLVQMALRGKVPNRLNFGYDSVTLYRVSGLSDTVISVLKQELAKRISYSTKSMCALYHRHWFALICDEQQRRK